MEEAPSLMGSQLVIRAEAFCMAHHRDELGYSARMVLLVMAANAHDTGSATAPQGCYFRGWEHLAVMIGHEELGPSGKRAVARAVAELVAVGVVKRDELQGHDKRKAVYRLMF